jgi:hypothetical protein
MKKVIFYLLFALLIQSCTNELREIDSVVSSHDYASVLDQNIESMDVPHNSFSAFYYYVENNKATVSSAVEMKIDHHIEQFDQDKNDFSAYWEGYFDFDSGDYEFTVKADKTLKVYIDDIVIFDGNGSTSNAGVQVNRSLEGIRRLKVFYNMNSSQKVQKIIDYYRSLRAPEGDEESESVFNTSTRSQGNNAENQNVLLDWRKL